MRNKKTNYKHVRIINPTAAWHTSRVHPCQGLLLKLRKPMMFLPNCSEDAEFEVYLFSEFLSLDKIEDEAGDKVYLINQKYDLTSWVDYGEVLLGEITIKVVKNTHPDKKEFSSNICVILYSKNDSVITVVNPMGNTVKMQPHQLLEVVCFEGSWNNWEPGKIEADGLHDSWKVTDNGVADKLKLHQAKFEIAGDRSELKEVGTFAIKNRFGFCPNLHLAQSEISSIVQEAKKTINPVREHHWWFSCTEETRKEVMALSNDTYRVCNLDFEGKCDDSSDSSGKRGFVAWRSLEVLFSVHGKNKHKMRPYYLNQDSIEHKMELVKRVDDRYMKCLTNPLAVEQVDFYPGHEELTVEIVQPNAFWTDLDDNVRWEISVDNHHLISKHISIVKLNDYCRWGKTFQRFRIEHNYNPNNDTETKALGAVLIICNERSEHHDGRRRISCWLTPSLDKRTSVPNARKSANTGCVHIYGKKKDRDYNGTPKVCTVEFEEIEEKTLEGAAKTRKLSDIYIVSRSHVSYSECDFYGPYYQDAKKKASSTLDSHSRQLFNSQNGNSNGKKDSAAEKKSESTGSASTTGQKTIYGNNANRPAFIVYNPEHLHQIHIEYGQSLVVRMTPPFSGEYWTLNHTTLNDAMKVSYFRTYETEGKVYQEALIRVGKVQMPGEHPMGCLRFECSKSQRSVFVLVRGREKVSSPICEFHMVTANKVFEGLKGKRIYLSEWQHNDAVVVSASETFYIRNPSFTSDCPSWHMEIEQFALPDAVWQSDSLKDVIRDIDIENPWFKKATPLQLASTYIFRPLEIQQPHVKAILRAVTEVTKMDRLPIARIVFRNINHRTNSRVVTPFGVIESTVKLERALSVCVALGEFAQRQLVMDNPDDKEEVTVGAGELLTVKLTPCFVEVERTGKIECPWYVGSTPSFLDFNGMLRESGDNVFRFKARRDFSENRKDSIKFICGNNQKDILATYEK